MGLPAKLTHEEQALLNKFAQFKKKKKAAPSKAVANADVNQAPTTPTKKDGPSENRGKEAPIDPKDAKEKAKQLLASGQLKISKENGQRSFKRARASVSEKKSKDSTLLEAAFSTKEQSQKIENIRRQSYSKFVVSSDSGQELEQKSNNTEFKRKGNNLFVTGYGLTKDILDSYFPKYGPIKNIYFDADKGHGYVTYRYNEHAEKAIVELHGEMKENVTLRVMHARKRTHDDNRFTYRPRGPRLDDVRSEPKDLDRKIDDPVPASRLAAESPTKKRKETRTLIKYDIEDFDF